MTATIERNMGRGVGRVPPHSREAEESVLGALLLAPHAANEVMDKLIPNDFYVPAHQSIFEAMVSLYNLNQPIDAVTLSEELRRSGELEKVGGLTYLTHLVDVVPTASNVEYYAGIVEEHGLRRSLIKAGSSITELAFRTDDEVVVVIDRAEQEVLGVAEKRAGDGMIPIGPLFQEAIEHIEALEANGSEITGLSTGFRDLDKKLAGLQKANLVVIAARPSMGKSALTINIATFVAGTGKTVAIFSLEMAKEEVVQRILSSVGKVESSKLRTGQLGNQWDRLVAAANRMYKTPIYVDDSSVVTVTDIRAKCRRLKRIKGLDLVVVDYLQLMQGSSRENRQQEIAEISRGLKNLARELEVPIIAVSQLNRSVEQREDRRPRLSDLRECLTAETEILRSDNGQSITIGEIARQGLRNVPVWSLDASMKTVPSVMTEAWSTGVKPVFKVTTASGRAVRATANHPLLTIDGWQQVGALAPGDRIAVPRRIPEPTAPTRMAPEEIVFLGHMIGDGSYLPRQPLRYTSADPANHEALSAAAQARFGVTIKVNPLLDRSWQTRLVSPYRVTHGRRNPVCQWLDELGIYGQRSPQKRLPHVLFGIPNEQVRDFLRHLWATDGSISVRSRGDRVGIYFASSSHGLAQDVYQVLLRVDLQPRLIRVDQGGGYGDGWQVVLSGADVQRRFLTEIGCHGRRGEVVSIALDVLSDRVANTNVDTIPVEVWSRIRRSASQRGSSFAEIDRRLGLVPSSVRRRVSPSRARVAAVAELLADENLANLAVSDVLWDRIVSIEPDGEEEVFDAAVPVGHNFIASLVFAHNSGALEQDADVVVFIYRHEYYHPDDIEKRGTAEVIIAKHRAGATGTVEMTFMPDFTRFADLGRDLA
jgi:replicative DNA helicase